MISSVDLFFRDESEEQNITNLAQIRRTLRNKSDPFTLPDVKFINIFRINKSCLHYLVSELNDKFQTSYRTSSIPPILKICAALRFFASGSYQQNIGDDFNIGMAQPTISQSIKEVVVLVETHLCEKWIKFEQTDTEKLKCKISFMSKYNFPGVIGCIDGTHIKIIAPNKHERHLYYNRKGYYSLNAMIICDHNLIIKCIDSRYPGANHDSFIWNNSLIYKILAQKYANGDRNSWLLGDSGYPLSPFLITPYKMASPESRQAKFNKIHSSARNIVERTIGVLKSRFRCLIGARELHYSPDKAKKIINTCCVLHNLCRFYNVENIEEEIPIREEIDIEQEQDTALNNLSREGNKIRDEILSSIL